MGVVKIEFALIDDLRNQANETSKAGAEALVLIKSAQQKYKQAIAGLEKIIPETNKAIDLTKTLGVGFETYNSFLKTVTDDLRNTTNLLNKISQF